MNGWSQEFPCRGSTYRGQGPGFNLLLKRNCSISPSGLLLAFGLIATATLGTAVFFAWLGAWMILPFAGVELVCLGIAFLVNGRHAADYERIALDAGRLLVEVRESDSTRRHEFSTARASVKLAGGEAGGRVLLAFPGQSLEIGRHLPCRARRDLASELNRRLRN